MYEQLAGVIRDMKCVMKNFKVFFGKYLQPDENHFQRQNESKNSVNQQSIKNKFSNIPPKQNINKIEQVYD